MTSQCHVTTAQSAHLLNGLLDQISSGLVPALKCDSALLPLLLVTSLLEASGSFFILINGSERIFSHWFGLMAGVERDSRGWVLRTGDLHTLRGPCLCPVKALVWALIPYGIIALPLDRRFERGGYCLCLVSITYLQGQAQCRAHIRHQVSAFCMDVCRMQDGWTGGQGDG